MQKIFLKDDKTLKRFNHINVFVGEENADELQILIPQEGYNGIDLSNCQIKLTYITPDEIENSFLINEFKQTELYKNYYVYSILIDKYFTYKNGRILLYLTFIDTVNNIDIVLKTDETYLDIKNHHSGSNEPSQAELDIIDQVTLISNSALQNSEQAISLVNWIKEKIENGDFDGEDGYSPTIEEYSTETEYRLIIHNKDSDFESPNLISKDNYEDLRHLPKVNNVEITGNKTSQDLGLTSSSEFSGLSEIVNALSDNLDENYYTKENVDNIVDAIQGIRDIVKVNELPTENISPTTLYLLVNDTDVEDNYCIEYMYIQNQWEVIGNTNINIDEILANYVSKAEVDSELNSSSTNPIQNKVVYELKEYLQNSINTTKQDIQSNINLYFAKKTDLNTKQDTLTAGAGIVINNNIISADAGIKILVVQELPSVDIDTKAIYFLPKTDSETNNVYDEYIYVNNAWELIGTTEIDLSDYVTRSEFEELEGLPTHGVIDVGKFLRINAQGQAVWDEVNIDLSNYLAKDNTTPFTPTGDYNPVTKKYVDDNIPEGLPSHTIADADKVLTIDEYGNAVWQDAQGVEVPAPTLQTRGGIFAETVQSTEGMQEVVVGSDGKAYVYNDYSSLVHAIVGTAPIEEQEGGEE